MIPAKRIFMSTRTYRFALLLDRLNQLVDRLGFVKRLAHRQSRAHASIQRAPLQELLVAPLGRDATAIEHQNRIGVANCGQAMGDDDCRASSSQFSQSLEDELL